jgi:hypothetical protein
MSENNGRNRGGWSKAGLAYLDQVIKILDGLADYWPLTLRQLLSTCGKRGHCK